MLSYALFMNIRSSRLTSNDIIWTSTYERQKKQYRIRKRYEISITFIANCDKEKYDDKHVIDKGI